MSNFILLVAALFSCFVLSSKASALEDGISNYIPGFYGDFSMATIPEKGLFLNNFLGVYGDPNGQSQSALELPGIIFATGHKILGGHFVLGIYPGLLFTKYSYDHESSARVGLTDLYLIPFGVNWHWDNLDVFAYEGILAPTGFYSSDALSTGLNIWTFDHNVAATWRLPKDNELSINFGYMNNLKNNTTDYLSGDLLHIDYLIGHYFTPAFGFGLTGTYHLQVSPDIAAKEILALEDCEGSSIGPVVSFSPALFKNEITFTLKWLHEFNVVGRDRQDLLVLKLWKEF